MLSHWIYNSEYIVIALYLFENLKRKGGMETSGSHRGFLVARSDSVQMPRKGITTEVSNPHPAVTPHQKDEL